APFRKGFRFLSCWIGLKCQPSYWQRRNQRRRERQHQGTNRHKAATTRRKTKRRRRRTSTRRVIRMLSTRSLFQNGSSSLLVLPNGQKSAEMRIPFPK